jgi:alkanesulfonate monooxygenase SsuD/methylene tetrahydromethanopterin reductase-like flavin-dependent oxidoreductase (luciferase family)
MFAFTLAEVHLMNCGVALFFQGLGRPDREVYRNEIRLGDLAEPLGFQAIWSVEHHFDDYTMVPDVTQFLTFWASRTKRVQLGSEVVVLPWHNPIRVAEEVALLDQLSNGRFIFGMGRGRGVARLEFEGLGVNQEASRDLFIESVQMILQGLETGEYASSTARSSIRCAAKSGRGRSGRFGIGLSPRSRRRSRPK